MSDQEVGSLVLTSVFDRPPQALRSGEASDDVCRMHCQKMMLTLSITIFTSMKTTINHH